MSPMACLLLIASTAPAVGPPPANELPPAILAILEKADTVELYSLDRPAENDRGETFRGQTVLGKTTLEAKARNAILDPLRLSFSRCPNWTFARVLINRPWIGLRVKSGDQSVDLLLNMRWGWLTAHQGKRSFGKYAITNQAQATIDRALAQAKVPIARGRSDEERPPIAKTILEKAELVELYSLEPMAPEKDKGPRLHGYKVLGKVAVKDAKERAALLGTITPALVPDVYADVLRAMCFRPRHAFRMKYEGAAIDVLICYECNRIEFQWKGARDQLGKLAKQEGWARITPVFTLDGSTEQSALDKLLTRAKVPLAKPASGE